MASAIKLGEPFRGVSFNDVAKRKLLGTAGAEVNAVKAPPRTLPPAFPLKRYWETMFRYDIKSALVTAM